MNWGDLLLGVIGSAGLASIVIKIIDVINERQKAKRQRRDEEKQLLEEILHRLQVGEKDDCRQQLLLLMADYPDDVAEIMTIAEHYFKDLNSNWYLTTIFNKWLERKKIARPEWFERS